VSRRRLGGLTLTVAALALAACGYSFQGTLPSHIKTVSVPMFVNRTSQPGVEGIITQAVVHAFATNGRLRVVRTTEADAILDGEVTGYSVGPIAFSPSLGIQEYRLSVVLNLRMRDVRRNVVIFQQNGVSEIADFRVVVGAGAALSGSTAVSVEQTALTAAAGEIARSIVSLAIDRF
jgi:outer membrane lipopolysaccharide assembly protein LptE/RlpB